jgi:hypothetical protein
MDKNIQIKSRRGGVLAAFAVLWTMAGCDTAVTNPGKLGDADLSVESAMPVILVGIAGEYQVAMNQSTYDMSTLMGEQNGASIFTSKVFYGVGNATVEMQSEVSLNNIHTALWVAQDGVRRMREVMGTGFATNKMAAEALTWGGFAARLLGDNFCESVIAGGSKGDRKAYYTLAKTLFTEGIAIAVASAASDVEKAAYGGRASVNLQLLDYTAASADAAKVPTDFLWEAEFSSNSTRERNKVWNESHNRINSSTTYTWFWSHYTATSDPRTPWSSIVAIPFTATATIHAAQEKYPQFGSNIPVSKGSEMRLIEAEGLLKAGDYAGALAKINALRTAAGIPVATATNATEAFDALLKERAIVMWLEGRRGGDFYRWGLERGLTTADDPILGHMVQYLNLLPSSIQTGWKLAGRDTCFPIGLAVSNANPNIS